MFVDRSTMSICLCALCRPIDGEVGSIFSTLCAMLLLLLILLVSTLRGCAFPPTKESVTIAPMAWGRRRQSNDMSISNGVAGSDVLVYVNTSTLLETAIQDGVWVLLSLCPPIPGALCTPTVQWNQSIHAAAFNALVVLTPDGPTEGRFEDQTGVGLVTEVVVAASGEDVALMLGPSSDVVSVYPMTLTFASSSAPWSSNGVATSQGFTLATPITIIPTVSLQSTRSAARALSVAAAVIGTAAGPSVWIGVAALQTSLVVLDASCSPSPVQYVFDDTEYIFVPLKLAVDDPFFLLVTQAGIAVGVCVLHAAAVLVHYFGVMRMSLRHSASVVYFPSIGLYFVCLFFVGIAGICYAPLAGGGESALYRVLTLLIAALIFFPTAAVWISVLYSGSENFYKYNTLDSLPRLLRLCLPLGSWPKLRSFTPVRGLCRPSGCIFTLVIALPMTVIGIAAGYTGANGPICYGIFVNAAVFHGVFLLVSVYLRPFRVPLLNLLWAVARCLDITLCGMLASWSATGTAQLQWATQIGNLGVALVSVEMAFNSCACVILWVERIRRLHRYIGKKDSLNHRREENDRLDEELHEAVLHYEHALQMSSLTGTVSSPAAAAAADSASSLALHNPCTMELKPVPEGVSEGELMQMIFPFHPADVEYVGRSAFITFGSRSDGLRAVAALHGRLLFHTHIACTLFDYSGL